MPVVLWILLTTTAISLMALVGIVTLVLSEKLLHAILPALVSFAAGTLLGGAFLHLLMESLAVTGPRLSIFVWLLAGFSVFFVLEQYLQWHHHYLPPHHHQHYHPKRPVTYMILLADGLHNLLGGLAVGGSFLVSTEAGLITAVAAAAHEIPQELGDFGILLHGGWRKRKALLYNFISALTIIPGGLLAVAAAGTLDTVYLLPFAAGNFIYIATADLIPEIKHETDPRRSSLYFLAFALGIALLLAVKVALGG